MDKYNELKKYLAELESVTVAFSGGVDSTLLLLAAKEALGHKAHGVIAKSEFVPERESQEAIRFVKNHEIEYNVINISVLKDNRIVMNPTNRCYFCKKTIFTEILNIAKMYQSKYVVEGSNMDDENDYRPGMKAVEELGIKSPLREVGLYKEEIRDILKTKKIEVWSKPAFSCLATRLPFGENITGEKLQRIAKAEQYLIDLGFGQIRVRTHDNLARIEIDTSEFEKILDVSFMNKINSHMKNIGFQYVTLDLQGYKSGRMNESL